MLDFPGRAHLLENGRGELGSPVGVQDAGNAVAGEKGLQVRDRLRGGRPAADHLEPVQVCRPSEDNLSRQIERNPS